MSHSSIDRKSFSILIRQHHRQLLVYARSLTRDEEAARDIVQEAFVTGYGKLDEFDVDRDFGAWMRGITRNKWREWGRQKARENLRHEELLKREESVAAWEQVEVETRGRLFEFLESCLGLLPEGMEKAVRTFYLEELSGEETAERMGVQPATIRKRLERARRDLRVCLERRMGGEKTPIELGSLNLN